ncbi:ABC transporter permease [Petroclostridium sp. X23]|uniref:ABC transporter permease n=1 Tax=Petroclostridium sp. X23 TaxID=3045146 RepID=UPI0024ADC8D9|nr:ABC transporter permease [Petroclostridium sp. X23]WHH57271.1 ABC transporter permease [Petroclostridium sp. X23]
MEKIVGEDNWFNIKKFLSGFSGVGRDYRSELAMSSILIVFFIVMSLASPFFFTKSNISNVISQIAVLGIIAIGQTYVIITSGVDLSVGSLLGLTSMLMGMTMVRYGIAAGVVVALLSGIVFGILNGILIGYLKLPAFIVTLSTLSIGRSMTYVVSNGNAVTGLPSSFEMLSKGKIFGIPYYLTLVVFLFFIWSWVTNNTTLGRYTYAIGSDEEATRLSGINVSLYKAIPYVVVGFLVGIASLVQSSRLMVIDPTFGNGLELDTIAAVVIGGTSFMGGRGTLLGTAIGVILLGFLRNSLNLIEVNPFWQGTVIGSVIIAILVIEKATSKRHC